MFCKFGIGKLQVSRLYHSGSKSRPGKSIKPPEYRFGNFSKLLTPKTKEIEYTSKSAETIKSFDELKVFPSVRTAMLHEIRYNYNFKNTYMKSKEEVKISPTPVQVASIRKINRTRTKKASENKFKQSKQIYNELVNNLSNTLKVFTMAAETGSGKTWAYLSVILSKLKDDDLEAFNRSVKVYEESRTIPMVRTVILVPTNELIDQIYETVSYANKVPLDLASNEPSHILNDKRYKEFLELEETKGLNFNIVKWGAGEPASKFFGSLQNRIVDILITTPTKLQSLGKQHTDKNPYRYLYNVQYCVVDEADTLFDPSWVNDTTAILSKFSKAKDLVLCSATMPKKFVKTVERYFKDSNIDVISPSLHKLPKQINVKIIDSQLSPFNGSKTRCLAQALYAIQKDGTESGHMKRVIVFVNHKKDVLPLVSILATKYHQDPETLIGLSGDDSPVDRAEKIKAFVSSAQELPEGVESKLQVLVTTDLFARGVNFNGVKNVILMDFPNNSVDLVHRIGRTGRMKQSGRVFIITDKKTSKSWIKSLPNATKQGLTIG